MDARNFSSVDRDVDVPCRIGERRPGLSWDLDGATECREIPLSDMAFQPHSFADPDGRVFHWQGRLYRSLTARGAANLHQLQTRGVLRHVVERGLLIETTPTALRVPGADLVVEHRELPFVSYPHEWSPAMFKQATLTILDLASEVATRGFTLKDGHPWNVLFDGPTPTFVDLGSIVPLGEPECWPAREEFDRYCLHPLLLMSRGLDHMARCMLPTDTGVTASDVRSLGGPARRWGERRVSLRLTRLGEIVQVQHLAEMARELQRIVARVSGKPVSLVDELRELRDLVAGLPLPKGARPPGGMTDAGPSIEGTGEVARRRRDVLRRVVRSLQPATLLAVGDLDMQEMVASPPCAADIVTFSADVACAAHLYSKASHQHWPLLPLIMDIAKPTPSVGWGSYWAMDARERLRCQMVVAADCVPELSLRRRFTMSQVVDGLSAFSSKWLVLEWPHPVAKSADEERPEPEMTCREVADVLEKEFQEVRVVVDQPTGTTVMVCERS